MRKSFIAPVSAVQPKALPEEEWLDIARVAKVEVTSEDPNFPIESALLSVDGPGWRAAAPGAQIVRIVFDKKINLRHIRLEFSETENERTQEFTLRWSKEPGGPLSAIVRQQWTFSPQDSTTEIEDYQISLSGVAVLELALKPNLTPGKALGSLAKWRMA
jgi:hypothetical protein